jgi:hypothetical protein
MAEPPGDELRAELSRIARKAEGLPVCTEGELREAGAVGATSAMPDVKLRKQSDFDPAFLHTGWFLPDSRRDASERSSNVVMVFMATEARMPTDIDINGLFAGRGIAIQLAERRPLCEIPIAFKSTDDGSINYHELFARALQRAKLGELTPDVR